MKRQGLLALNSVVVFLCLIGLWQAVVWLNHLPPYILPGPMLVAQALHDRYPSLLNSLWITTEEAAGGLIGSVVVGVATAMIFRAMAMAAADALSLYNLAANGADRGHRTADHQLGRRRHIFSNNRDIHHLPRADHRQHDTRPGKRGREPDSLVCHAQSDTGTNLVQASAAQRHTEPLYRNSHLGRHQCDRWHHRRVVRGINARRRRWLGLRDHLCE